MDESTPTAFDDFWEASSLTSLESGRFAALMESFEERAEPVHPFDQAAAEIDLPVVRDRLQRTFERRRSERAFSDRPFELSDVAKVLAAAGSHRDGERRVIPSAGGFDTVHVYAFLRTVRSPAGRSVVRYVHREHRIAPVAELPGDGELRRLFGIGGDLPQLLLAFVVDPRHTLAKYGERGGRFLLQEVGHAAQNVGIRLAEEQLRGYPLGGLLDTELLCLMGLQRGPARVVSGYACGR